MQVKIYNVTIEENELNISTGNFVRKFVRFCSLQNYVFLFEQKIRLVRLFKDFVLNVIST